MSICKVHIHLSPLNMGTVATKILKLKQRSLEWVLRMCGQQKVTQIVEVSSAPFKCYILQKVVLYERSNMVNFLPTCTCVTGSLNTKPAPLSL